MPRTQEDEEQEHGGNPQEAKGEKGATASGLSEKDMKELYATLDKMKIKPDNFISWLTKQAEEEKKPNIPIPPKTPVTLPRQLPSTSQSDSNYKAPLRISFFSGEEKDSYDLWKYEVICLMKESHSEQSILQAIRRSVKGEAAKVIMRLGVGANVQEILSKLDSIYGNVLEKEDILAEFYSAKQRDEANSWSWVFIFL